MSSSGWFVLDAGVTRDLVVRSATTAARDSTAAAVVDAESCRPWILVLMLSKASPNPSLIPMISLAWYARRASREGGDGLAPMRVCSLLSLRSIFGFAILLRFFPYDRS